MEAGDIADSGRTSHELCDKRCLRLAVDFDRRSRLFDMSMVGYDDLICNLNCLILIVRDKMLVMPTLVIISRSQLRSS